MKAGKFYLCCGILLLSQWASAAYLSGDEWDTDSLREREQHWRCSVFLDDTFDILKDLRLKSDFKPVSFTQLRWSLVWAPDEKEQALGNVAPFSARYSERLASLILRESMQRMMPYSKLMDPETGHYPTREIWENAASEFNYQLARNDVRELQDASKAISKEVHRLLERHRQDLYWYDRLSSIPENQRTPLTNKIIQKLDRRLTSIPEPLKNTSTVLERYRGTLQILEDIRVALHDSYPALF